MYELQSRSVLMTKSAFLPGAGFWPLAGCSASQPLPKMWEARISGKSVVHPIGVCHVIVSSHNHATRTTGPRAPDFPRLHQDVGCVNTVMSNWKRTAGSAYAKVQTWWVWMAPPPSQLVAAAPLWVDHQVMFFQTPSDCGLQLHLSFEGHVEVVSVILTGCNYVELTLKRFCGIALSAVCSPSRARATNFWPHPWWPKTWTTYLVMGCSVLLLMICEPPLLYHVISNIKYQSSYSDTT